MPQYSPFGFDIPNNPATERIGQRFEPACENIDATIIASQNDKIAKYAQPNIDAL
jgi:hypothetical protein